MRVADKMYNALATFQEDFTQCGIEVLNEKIKKALRWQMNPETRDLLWIQCKPEEFYPYADSKNLKWKGMTIEVFHGIKKGEMRLTLSAIAESNE